MTTKSDWKRGAQNARQAFELLRARWPKAFPAKSHEVRPIVNITAEVQEAFGWSPAYAKGVLGAWKARESYCRAVLAYPYRVGLDGSPTEGIVDDQARQWPLPGSNRSPPRRRGREAREGSRRPRSQLRRRQNPRPAHASAPESPLTQSQSAPERASSSHSARPRKRRWPSAGSGRPRSWRPFSGGRG